jgi:hypothetical protein
MRGGKPRLYFDRKWGRFNGMKGRNSCLDGKRGSSNLQAHDAALRARRKSRRLLTWSNFPLMAAC